MTLQVRTHSIKSSMHGVAVTVVQPAFGRQGPRNEPKTGRLRVGWAGPDALVAAPRTYGRAMTPSDADALIVAGGESWRATEPALARQTVPAGWSGRNENTGRA